METRDEKGQCALLFDGLAKVVRDALIITALCAAAAVTINATIHPRAIPLIATKPYEILVPCPEPGGAVSPMAAQDPRVAAPRSFRLDAREASAFAAWHLHGATNVTYDYLDPTPKALLERLARKAAASGAKRVVVYGDGDDPDSGEQLGKELARYGIKNVFFVRGGAPALRKAGQR